MFTGLIETLGRISIFNQLQDGRRVKIQSEVMNPELKPDDSVAVNGVCLTVTKKESNGFWVDAVGETLTKTTLKNLKKGQKVNLERALRLSDRLGGHLVQGHINGIATISAIQKKGENYLLKVMVPEKLLRYIVAEGSIALDGISLTVADLQDNLISLSIIPHTWNHTNLQFKTVGDKVNVEIDIIAKYIEKLLAKNSSSGTSEEKFSENWFNKLGYE
ncbi:MAG: riboflavin synthase [Caldithrix sp.]|nr:riboflavin synthase [Caldithrix sp.]